jgi:hypothetical protein
LLLFGEPNQLPPVGRGDIFTNTIECAREYGCVIELTKIHRQVETNPIYKIGQHVCKGIDPKKILDFVDGDIVQFYTPSSYTDDITMAVELKKQYSLTPFDLQIITPWKCVESSINAKYNLQGQHRFQTGLFVMCTSNISTTDFDKFRARQRIFFLYLKMILFVNTFIKAIKSSKAMDTET